MEKLILKQIEGGILGFEDIESWEVVNHSENHIELISTNPESSAKFNLVKSTAFREFEGDHYISEDAYYVICIWADTPTINTKSPVIVSDQGIYQKLTATGNIRQPVTFDAFNSIIA